MSAGGTCRMPLNTTRENYLRQLDKLGLESTPQGKIREKRSSGSGTETTASTEEPAP